MPASVSPEVFLGKHIIAELSGCRRELLADCACVRRAMLEAAEAARAHVVAESFHRFPRSLEPGNAADKLGDGLSGVSGVVVIEESHISVHTWPEAGYVALDAYTCGEQAMPLKAVAWLVKALGARSSRVSSLERGLLENQQGACGEENSYAVFGHSGLSGVSEADLCLAESDVPAGEGKVR